MVLLSADLCLTGPPDNVCLLTGPHLWLESKGFGAGGVLECASQQRDCMGLLPQGMCHGLCLKKGSGAGIAKCLFSRIIQTALETSQC